MKKKYAVIFWLVSAVLISGCQYGLSTHTPLLTPTAFALSKNADRNFFSLIDDNVDINNGITVERAMPLYPEQSNNVTFAVFNHTDEKVIFADQVFGLIALGYDDAKDIWTIIKLQRTMNIDPIILPPNLEKWDFEVNNICNVLEDEFGALGYSQIRFYVTGQGITTNIVYGAYLDVIINR